MSRGQQGLGAYAEQIADYVRTLLGNYIAQTSTLIEQGYKPQAKELNDPVWGTVVLQPHEVVVLDSPILQRLRRIRQLGVAHLVYPAALHSRLEHSIGVCHQVARLAGSINSHSTTGDPLLGEDQVRLLRMTGLCHDVGHGLMSHVVENALRDDDSVNALLLAFKRLHKKDGQPQLSELAAHYMLASEPFSDLVRFAFEATGLTLPADFTKNMSQIVVGLSIGDEFPLVHELISGPFDADKLDYMPRDAAMCGVPVVTDINRLIQKVRAVKLPTGALPQELGAIVRADKSESHLIVGIAASGASTLDEVALGRSLMFDKIYRHHKVRAAEMMVNAALDQLKEAVHAESTLVPLLLHDDDFLLLDAHPEALEALPEGQRDTGLDIVRRLRTRRLFVRAFAFSQHLPQDPYRGDPESRQAIERLIRDTAIGERRREFVVEIGKHVSAMLKLLGASGFETSIAGTDPVPYIWVDPPASSIPDAKPDPNHAYLIAPDGRPRRVDQVNAETRGWSDAYVNTHDIGYVFTTRELAPLVYIGAELAANDMFGYRAPENSRAYTKLPRDLVDDLRRRLEELGFYDSLAPEFRPLPDVLRLGDAAARLQAIRESLQGYQGPVVDVEEPGTLKESSFNVSRIQDWVRQFGPEHAKLALLTAENVRLLGRQETNAALASFFESDAGAKFRGGSVVPIGQPKDGSAIVSYHQGDVARRYEAEVRDLVDALSSTEGPIVLVDDFIGRGSSTISILAAHLDEPEAEELGEQRPSALAESARAAFRERPLALVYCAGREDGVRHLEDELQRFGFADATVHVYLDEREIPTLSNVLAQSDATEEEAAAFINRCADIGRNVLESQGMPRDTAEQRSLGYGNEGLLLVFPYNTPTATLTALWASGEYSGWRWRALFPRRKKR